MLNIATLLTEDRVLHDLDACSKRKLLRRISDEIAAREGMAADTILDALQEREQLGSTAVGRGVAVPHAKVGALPGLSVLFCKLHEAVNYEAQDDQPVDLVFVILTPECSGGNHLKLLAKISRMLRQPDMLTKLRQAESQHALHGLLRDSLCQGQVEPRSRLAS